ncbi:hypothetical protein LMIV_1252 [Listeria monocytogenes FSL J1-208]|nr:hypothetical protein LMIV_1252 [Listeria monocytogenes FSL J1-208]
MKKAYFRIGFLSAIETENTVFFMSDYSEINLKNKQLKPLYVR